MTKNIKICKAVTKKNIKNIFRHISATTKPVEIKVSVTDVGNCDGHYKNRHL